MDKKEFGPLSSNTLVFILRNTSLLIFGCFRYFYLPPFLLLPLFLSLWSSLIPCATQIAVPNWLLEMYDLLIDHFTFSIHFHWFWYNNYLNDRWSYPSRPVGSQCLLWVDLRTTVWNDMRWEVERWRWHGHAGGRRDERVHSRIKDWEGKEPKSICNEADRKTPGGPRGITQSGIVFLWVAFSWRLSFWRNW